MGDDTRPCMELESLEFRTFDAGSHWKRGLDDRAVAEEEAAQARAWRRGLWVRFFAAPVVWIKRWRTARQVAQARASHRPESGQDARLAELLAHRAAFVVEEGRLVSERHGWTLDLPEDAVVSEADRVAWRDNLAFVVHLGAFRIQATVHTADQIRALAERGIAGARASIDEDVMLGGSGWPARVLRVHIPAVDDRGRVTGTHRRWVAFVAGPESVLKLEAADQAPEEDGFDSRFREVARGACPR